MDDKWTGVGGKNSGVPGKWPGRRIGALPPELDPFSPRLFVFCNRQRDKLKILFWEHNNVWLCYRRLERRRFVWPNRSPTRPARSAVESIASAYRTEQVGVI